MFLEKVYTGRNQWYLYVATLIIIFISIQLTSIPLGIYLLLKNPGLAQSGIAAATSTNLGLALTLFTFAGGIVALFLCVKHLHDRNYLDVVTARKKIDWKRFFFAAGIWAVLTIVTTAVQILFADTSQITFHFEPANFIAMFIVSLLLFPVQTSCEELVCRGYLMQWFGYLFKYRWAALALTSILFGVLHGSNPEVDSFGIWTALPIYIIMGGILGYVAIKDDGLELACGLHFANNFLAAITFTSDASALQTHALFRDSAPSASWVDSVVILCTGLIFIWICNRKYHFFHKNNLNEKIVPEEIN